MNCSSLFYIVLTTILILLVVAYLVMPYRRRTEGFSDRAWSTREVWQRYGNNIATLDRKLKLFIPVASDKDDLLLMKRCYQFNDYTIPKLIQDVRGWAIANDTYNENFELMTCDFNEVKSMIQCRIQNFYETLLCDRKSDLTLCKPFTNTIHLDQYNGQKCNFNLQAENIPRTYTRKTVSGAKESDVDFAKRIWREMTGSSDLTGVAQKQLMGIVAGKQKVLPSDLRGPCELALNSSTLKFKANDFGCNSIIKNNLMMSKGKNLSEASCTQKIQGPVYIMITQAPYYRNELGDPITLQFQTSDYDYYPYNKKKGSPDTNAPIYYSVMIIAGKYNSKGQLRGTDLFKQMALPWWDTNAATTARQCEIRTRGDYNTFGGCGTIPKGQRPYESTCLGPNNPSQPDPNDERKRTATYSVLYTLNPNYTTLQTMLAPYSS